MSKLFNFFQNCFIKFDKKKGSSEQKYLVMVHLTCTLVKVLFNKQTNEQTSYFYCSILSKTTEICLCRRFSTLNRMMSMAWNWYSLRKSTKTANWKEYVLKGDHIKGLCSVNFLVKYLFREVGH